MTRQWLLGLALAFALAAPAAWADSCSVDGLPYKGVIFKGFADGQIVLQTSGGASKAEGVGKFSALAMDDAPSLAKAEAALADPKKAAGLYTDALRELGDRPKLRLVVQARALKAYEENGQWGEAVKTFLDLYKASPTAGTFEIRPTRMPAAGSSLLKDSADAVSRNLRDKIFSKPEPQKALKTFLLEIYTQAKDPRAAELAKDLGADVALNMPGTPGTPAAPDLSTPAVAGGSDPVAAPVEAALAGKKYEEALGLADAALAKEPPASTSIRLYTLKAEIYKAQNKLPEAALAYLRIPAHYASNQTQSAEALYQAAQVLERNKQGDDAKRLYREIVEKYRNTARFAAAKEKVGDVKP